MVRVAVKIVDGDDDDVERFSMAPSEGSSALLPVGLVGRNEDETPCGGASLGPCKGVVVGLPGANDGAELLRTEGGILALGAVVGSILVLGALLLDGIWDGSKLVDGDCDGKDDGIEDG